MIQKELLKLPVEDLVPYENNPRVISPESRWTKTMSSSVVTPAASL